MELVYIETVQDVLDVLSGQQLLPFARHSEREEEHEHQGVETKILGADPH
ncbi:hypothetical protein [uncultured Rossellomorea sp.]|nr:hypothetical protein [uncultured Rossellomorea sp.]